MLRSSSLIPRHRLSVGATFHSLLPPSATPAEIAQRHAGGRQSRTSACFEDWLDDAQPDFSLRYQKLSQKLEEIDSECVEFLDHIIDLILNHVGNVSAAATPSARKAHQQRRVAVASAMTLAMNQLLGAIESSPINAAVIQLAFAEQVESQFGTADSLCIEINSIALPSHEDDLANASGTDTATFSSSLDTVLFRTAAPRTSKVAELPTLIEAGLHALAFSTRHGIPTPALK